MKKRNLFTTKPLRNWVPLLVLSLLIQAQSSAQPGRTALPLPETGIKSAYIGSVIYPGFKIGIERPYQVIQVEKDKIGGTKYSQRIRYLTANLGFYSHPTFHENLYLLLERQKRRQLANGWFTEVAPGVGYSRTFLGGATYAVSDNGTVRKIALAGHNYALLSASVGAGYEVTDKQGWPVKIYGKISLLGMFPSNSFLYLRPTAEIGLVWSVPNFWKANPQLKIKKK